jgi:hypothetical protein
MCKKSIDTKLIDFLAYNNLVHYKNIYLEKDMVKKVSFYENYEFRNHSKKKLLSTMNV